MQPQTENPPTATTPERLVRVYNYKTMQINSFILNCLGAQPLCVHALKRRACSLCAAPNKMRQRARVRMHEHPFPVHAVYLVSRHAQGQVPQFIDQIELHLFTLLSFTRKHAAQLCNAWQAKHVVLREGGYWMSRGCWDASKHTLTSRKEWDF